jgi:DNA-binding GntR family transcriptional regulator
VAKTKTVAAMITSVVGGEEVGQCVPINRDSPIPVVEQLADTLRCEIQGERLTGKLPNRNDLAVQYGVSRWTLHEALKILRDEGLIVVSAKRGTWVIWPPPE